MGKAGIKSSVNARHLVKASEVSEAEPRIVYDEVLSRLSELSHTSAGEGINDEVKEDARRVRVGLIYDDRMKMHEDPEGDHPEQPMRIVRIFERLTNLGLTERCVRVGAREATNEELQSVHTGDHVALMQRISGKEFSVEKREELAHSFNSIYFNEGSSSSALLAAGSVMELARKVAVGELDNGVAVVRPPGHHAECDRPMGFCLFNNVAIAAKVLLDHDHGEVVGEGGGERKRVRRVLIVDWDVHHGNGIQNMFWNDRRVLYFSVHRYDGGGFYPGGADGNMDMVGGKDALGFNVNVPWPHGGFGDADYLLAWDSILLPLAEAFRPDITLISAGFDAAKGDLLGGCNLTPYGYAHMTSKLLKVTGGKIVLALEGGYNLESISSSFAACVSVLLSDPPLSSFPESFTQSPEAILTVKKVRSCLAAYWDCLRTLPPPTAQDGIRASSNLIPDESGRSDIVREEVEEEAGGEEGGEVGRNGTRGGRDYVWYASYGSNMWDARFLCYIHGGQVEGMAVASKGSQDKTPPVDDMWFVANHRMWFGRTGSITWGNGGVCFLDPRSSNHLTHIRLYKITREQFVDVLIQENLRSALREYSSNGGNGASTDPRAELVKVVERAEENGLRSGTVHTVDVFKEGWYGRLAYLGQVDSCPILTFTCPEEDVEKFLSGELPVNPPSDTYRSTLHKGLFQKGLSKEEAVSYIDNCSKPMHE